MATSERALRYLGSTRNIVGSCLALLGLVAHFLGLAGAYWPVVVVALYGAGALLAPPDRVRLTISHAEVETRALRADLDGLLGRVDRRFPEDVRAAVHALAEVIGGVLARAEQLTAPRPAPRGLADRPPLPARQPGGVREPAPPLRPGPAGRAERSAHEELLEQLALLDAQMGKVAEAMHRGDEQALRDQGRFLRDRFGGSDLDLG
ncbi:hypothetical protein ACFQ0B_36565 [Nonomuraea thailandensis]